MPFGIYPKVIRILQKECPRLGFTLRTYSGIIIANQGGMSRGKISAGKISIIAVLIVTLACLNFASRPHKFRKNFSGCKIFGG